MAEKKAKRLSKIAREFNVGIHTIVDFLEKKGLTVDSNPNTKVAPETYELLIKEYSSDIDMKKDSEKLNRIKNRKGNQSVSVDDLQRGEEEDDDDYDDYDDEEAESYDNNDDVLLITDRGISKTEKEDEKQPEKQSDSQNTSSEQQATDEQQKPAEEELPAEEEHKDTQDQEKIKTDQKTEPAQEKPDEPASEEKPEEKEQTESSSDQDLRIVGKIDLNNINEKTRPTRKKAGTSRKEQAGESDKAQKKPVDKKTAGNKVEKKETGKAPEKKDKPQEQPEPQAKQKAPDKGETADKPQQKGEAGEQRPKEEQSGAGQKQSGAKPKQAAESDKGKEQKSEGAKPEKKSKIEKPIKKSAQEQNKPEPEKQANVPENKEEESKSEGQQEQETPKDKDEFFRAHVEKLSGPTVVGRINLADKQKKANGEKDEKTQRPQRKKRKRIKRDKPVANQEKKKTTEASGDQKKEQPKREPKKVTKKDPQKNPKKEVKRPVKDDKRGKTTGKTTGKKRSRPVRQEVDEEDVQKQVKETLARLEARKKKSNKRTKRIKREEVQRRKDEEEKRQEEESKVLKVTEFISVNELAQMLNVHPNQVIAKCMELGMVVSINQRLDADTISVIVEEYNYKTEFVSIDEEDQTEDQDIDEEGEEVHRPPIVTVMGHVDHGKTSLLDYIRSENVIAGEAGGITQHIGAYHVTVEGDKSITFIDTPGHQAFTSMRARGAQVTDIAIIVVAADDDIMPQTKEAINHAEAAGVPIVFAINKIDKPQASPDKIKEKLANMNYLVEEWGGKYLSTDISAKNGTNLDHLMELVLLQAEMQELTAVEDKNAAGTVIEASLDKGRGYVATVLNQAGILKVGDYVLAGSYSGRIKAMFNERGKQITEVGPSFPAEILGLDGSPQPGDKFKVMQNEKEAREIATKRQQLQREQTFRTQRPMTLDEIGRRIAIGNFQEVNVIIKGDFDGSIEALSDSLMKLSTQEVQVQIIHKGVGEISESDVMLAAASKAVIVGFNVRPSFGARKMAEQQGIEIRLYSIIYDAINDMKDALEGMLDPEIKEEILGTAEVRETFKITKVGTIAGCMVKEGKINRNSTVRVIRDGIVIYTGELGSLKRYKDDAKEVVSGYECGLNIHKFNDIKVGDIIEAFKEKEVKRSLDDAK